MKYPPNLRASWHEYNDGMYFVTFCTMDRMRYLGEIADGKMNLSEVGKFADEQFRNVTAHYPYAEIPLWVVMPDHIHAIVVIHNEMDEKSYNINNNSWNNCGVKPVVVVARNDSTKVELTNNNPKKTDKSAGINEYMSSLSPKKNTLSVVIRGLKSAITKYAHEHSIRFVWQTKYHDRIIRNSAEMNSIAEYIENNVAQWDENKDIDY